MEHQHPLAQPSSTYLEAGSVRRERIVTVRPRASVIRLWCIGIVFAVVEDDLKDPAVVLDLLGRQKAWTPPAVVQQGKAVAITNELGVAVDRPPGIVAISPITFLDEG